MSLKLKIINVNFILMFDVRSTSTVMNLKEKIGNNDIFRIKMGDCNVMKCNLFVVRKFQNMENLKSIDYYNLENGDEIILTVPNTFVSETEKFEIAFAKITEKDIEEATKDLEAKNVNAQNPKVKEDTESILKSVLITMIEVAQNILCLNKTASNLFQYVHSEIESARVQVQLIPENSHINTLMEMGVAREKAVTALLANNNSLNSALNCLFSDPGASDQDHQDPVSNTDDIAIHWIKDSHGDLFIKPMTAKVILTLYRDYNRKFFRPHTAIRDRLIDMGFEESTVNEALRLNNNNEMSAVDSLLNPSSLVIFSEDELQLEGMPMDSAIIQAILANADIQLGLLNLYSLLAFLNIVDNPRNLTHWLANPETKNILQQISNITTDHLSSF